MLFHTLKCGVNMNRTVRVLSLLFFIIINCFLLLTGCTDTTASPFIIEYNDGAYALAFQPISKKTCEIVSLKMVSSGSEMVCQFPQALYLPDIASGYTVVSIGRVAVSSGSVKELHIPDTIRKIDDDAFILPELETVYIGQKVERISGKSFGYMSGLSTIYAENNDRLTSPEQHCLMDCTTNTLVLGTVSGFVPEWTKYIVEQAFCGRAIPSVQFPEGLESIGRDAFAACAELSGELLFPNSLMDLGEGAFRNTGITGWRGGSFEVLPVRAFWLCHNIQTVIIPANVKTIEMEAVCSSSIRAVYIPDSVRSIHHAGLFTGENAVVYCEENAKPEGWSDGWLMSLDDGAFPTVVWDAEIPE